MRKYWSLHLLAIFIVLLVLLLTHYDNFISLFSWWGVTSKYGHSMVVFPLIAYLVYESRFELRDFVPQPQAIMGLLLALLSIALVAFNFIHVEILSESLLVLMVPVIVWSIIGFKLGLKLFIPTLLILTTAPIWELFSPLLTDITTEVSYQVLKILGVPVFREGAFLNIPEGTFEVADGCGGFRYFIVGLTLGLSSAYLNFRTVRARVLVVGVAILLSMVGNWIRVMVVIWAGHVTDMQHSFVHEHVNLGWWIFASIFFPFFIIVNKIAIAAQIDQPEAHESTVAYAEQNGTRKLVASVILLSSIIVIVPLLLTSIQSDQSSTTAILSSKKPGAIKGWEGPYTYTGNWTPNYEGAAGEGTYTYVKGDRVLYVYIAYYLIQDQGKELVNFNNTLVNKNWKSYDNKILSLGLNSGESMGVECRRLSTMLGSRLMWSWYYVAGSVTPDRRIAKMLELKKLVGSSNVSAVVAVLSDDAQQEAMSEVGSEFIVELQSRISSLFDTF